MAGPVLLDAGPLVACFLKRDEHYPWAAAQLQRLEGPLLTCDAVISEAFFLVGASVQATEQLCRFLERNVVICDFNLRNELPSVLELIRRYRDVPMSLADACFVRMAELHENGKVFTLDAHFRTYRKNRRQPIPLIAPWQ
jgi:predicted nucleic acid-binding protein